MKAKRSEEISQLAAEILKHKHLYYSGKPVISDVAYDSLEAKLRQLDPQHPALFTVGSESSGQDKKVTHDSPMLSLAKTYELTELVSWMDGEAIVGSPKVDGNSLSLIYKAGRLVLAKTRGDGRVGEDVTEKIRWIRECPAVLPIEADCEVRGEVYCSAHAFAVLVEDMLSRGLERPHNPRNIVAGLLGRKAHIDLCQHFQFFAFDVLTSDSTANFTTEIEKYIWLENQGFVGLPHTLIRTEDELQNFLEEMKRRMSEDEVAYDGAVFAYDRLALHRQLGSTAHHPRFKMSFKWPGQTAEARIERIDWATSRLGIVTPVAVIEPVQLSGAKITNITLHNAEYVRAYNLKAGDRIEIIRSGEVIPKFLQVMSPGQGTFVWPKNCPSCDNQLEFDGVRLKCQHTFECQAQKAGFILNWTRCAEIDDLSEKRLDQMIQLGLIQEAPDLYRLKPEDLQKLPATKEKMAQKLYTNIQKSRDIPLAKFLNGLGIEGAGLRTWEKLLEHFHELESLLLVRSEQLVEIEGFAEKSAEQIVAGLKDRRSLIEKFLKAGLRPQVPFRAFKPGEGPLAGKQFVITGTLSRPRDEIEKLIRDAGGKAGSSVSKNTFALVSNEDEMTSSKMKKAKELGIPVWTEVRLLQELGSS